MAQYNHGGHTVTDYKTHLVWCTKYRYKVLKGTVALRLRELLRQGCASMGVTIIQGSIGKEHVHMMVSYPPSLSVSKMVQALKGRSSHLLQDEFPELKKRYWGQHMWARGYFGASVGAVDEETIRRYIENQMDEDVKDNFTIVGED